MADFNQVCKNLGNAVPLVPLPSYTIIDPIGLRVDDEIRQKLLDLWEKFKLPPPTDGKPIDFKPLGVCEVGDLSGNELLRVLVDICNKPENNQAGNYLYFHIEGQSKLLLLFGKTSLLTDHVSNANVHSQLLANAKKEFPKFLQKKITNFSLDPFGSEFISLLAKCAYRMSKFDGLRERNPAHEDAVDSTLMDKFENIPYPACIKLAFDAGLPEKISKLLGEGNSSDEDKRQGAVDVAEELIKIKLREKSKSAFSTGNPPDDILNKEGECKNKDLLKEVEKTLDKGKKSKSTDSGLTFNLIGCCEIGQLTGNEIIQVLLDVFEKERFQPGNQICLNVEGHSVAMLIFTKDNFLVVPQLSREKVIQEYRGLFKKLFSDKDVKSFQEGPHKDKYKQKLINKYRREAKGLFNRFLSTKFVDFTHLKYKEFTDQYKDLSPLQHRNCFLGLVAKCAFRMSSIDPVRKYNDEVEKVPFFRCIEIAFRTEKTGKISDLLGELPRTSKGENVTLEDIGLKIIETSKKLIDEKLPSDEEEKVLFDESKTNELVEEITNIFNALKL